MGNKNKQVFYLFIRGVFYFIFGFVTWLNGTLIPFLQKTCELNQFEAYLVTFAFYISYFVWSLPSSAILKKSGFKKGLAIGLFVMAIGAALFIPAASSRSYILFLLGLFILGSGLALMQTAVNPYVTILGPIETAARRMSIMGICNKFAGILAPIILGAVLLSGLDEIEDLTVLSHRLVTPYLIMTIVLVALGFLILAVDLPEPNEEEEESAKNTKKTIWQYPYLWFGIIALFFYVGVEVIAGDSVINYGRALGVDMISAKYFTSITLLGMVIGYFIGVALIPKVMSQRQALIGCSTLGILFAILALSVDVTKSITFPFIDLTSFHPITMHIPLTVLFVCLMGLANSLVWPAIWPLALDGVGHHTKTASALLIMAIAGGAVMPLILGKLNDVIGFQQAYWITIPCYVIILCFALFGYRLGKKR